MNPVGKTPDFGSSSSPETLHRSSRQGLPGPEAVVSPPSSTSSSQLSTIDTLSDAQSSVVGPRTLCVSLLTGGGDKPYALGMAAALTSAGVEVDFIGSDDLRVPELLNNPRVNFYNLR